MITKKNFKLYLTLLIILSFTIEAFNHKEENNNHLLSIKCPEVSVYEDVVFLSFSTSTNNDYVENIDISLNINGNNEDKLSIQRSNFELENYFEGVLKLDISGKLFYNSSKTLVLFTSRDKYGNKIKDYCEL